MTTKLVFMVPDKNRGRAVVQSLRVQGLDESDIHVVGKETEERPGLPDAGEFRNDVKPAAKRGAAIGGAMGLVGGLIAAFVAPELSIGAAAIALATVGGATFGVLAAALIGSSVPNSQIREYEDEIERGEVLIVVEAEEEAAAGITTHLKSEFPDIRLKGEVELVPPVV